MDVPDEPRVSRAGRCVCDDSEFRRARARFHKHRTAHEYMFASESRRSVGTTGKEWPSRLFTLCATATATAAIVSRNMPQRNVRERRYVRTRGVALPPAALATVAAADGRAARTTRTYASTSYRTDTHDTSDAHRARSGVRVVRASAPTQC